MNHVPQVYQGMEGVTTFLASFKDYPPRSVPPGFNPGQHDGSPRDIKAKQKLERTSPCSGSNRRTRRSKAGRTKNFPRHMGAAEIKAVDRRVRRISLLA